MKSDNKKRYRQPFLNYIISYSAIVFVIILAMGGYLYRFYYRTIWNDFQATNEDVLNTIVRQHENDMDIVEDIIMQMGISPTITEFKLEDQTVKSIKLEERLNQYTTVSQFFSQILYCYHEDEYIYNHATSVDIDMFLDSGLILENTNAQVVYEMLYDDSNGMKVLPEQSVSGYFAKTYGNNPDKVVIYFLPIAPKNVSTMAFLVSKKYYDELLYSEENQKSESYIFYDDDMIVSRGTLGLEAEQIYSMISNVDNGSEIEKINGDKYLVTWQEGESGLQYCVVQSIDIFQNKILTGQWGILALLILCAAPAALLIMWLSNNISKRLKHINGLLNEKEDASYDFDNIEAGIRTLVESNKEAKRESMPFRRTIFIGNFIRNEFKSEDEMLQAAEHVNIIVKNMYYIVVLMGDRENSNESKAHEVMLLEIERNQFVDGYGFNLIHNNQSLFVLFSGDKLQIELMIQNMLDIGKKYCEDFVLAVSDYHLEYLEASKAYLEADTAFDSRFLKDNDKVIRYEDEHDRTITEIIPDKYLQGLKNSIRTRNLSEMEENVNKICSQMKRENHSLLTFKILCNDIIHMMIAECNDRKINVNDIYSVFALSECLTIQDFNGILNDACRILMENQTIKPENEKDAVIEQAISYMNEHYQEAELNMGALADYLNISSVTLAVDFKNVVGRSPSDYLASIRMEHAKELLKQTDMRVKDVSFSVGYEDDHVFMRRFKKYTGMTPGQYRSEHEMEK